MVHRIAILTLALLHTAPAWAANQYVCRGKVTGPDGTLRGELTIASNSLSVTKRWLWVRESVAYDYKSLQSVRVRRGLMHTKVVLHNGNDGSIIKVRTWAWNYDSVYALFQSKL